MPDVRVLAAPDKFRGTATAPGVASAIAAGAAAVGATCVELPLADGGEGTLDAFGGPNRSTTVAGPLGEPVRAGWRLDGQRAVIEMSRASGLALVGGAAGNDPRRADTRGTGQLIVEAVRQGARRVIVGIGGSASTDGGLGAVEVAAEVVGRRDVEVIVGCDVEVGFVDAARRFAPQKGADPVLVAELADRLEALATSYLDRFGTDVRAAAGAGAGGGLAGGLHAAGARLTSGFDMVAEEVGLRSHVAAADLVVTGEGCLDESSLEGKVVGGVVDTCAVLGVAVLVVAGQVADGIAVPSHSLTATFGAVRARNDTLACVQAVVEDHLRVSRSSRDRRPGPPGR